MITPREPINRYRLILFLAFAITSIGVTLVAALAPTSDDGWRAMVVPSFIVFLGAGLYSEIDAPDRDPISARIAALLGRLLGVSAIAGSELFPTTSVVSWAALATILIACIYIAIENGEVRWRRLLTVLWVVTGVGFTLARHLDLALVAPLFKWQSVRWVFDVRVFVSAIGVLYLIGAGVAGAAGSPRPHTRRWRRPGSQNDRGLLATVLAPINMLVRIVVTTMETLWRIVHSALVYAGRTLRETVAAGLRLIGDSLTLRGLKNLFVGVAGAILLGSVARPVAGLAVEYLQSPMQGLVPTPRIVLLFVMLFATLLLALGCMLLIRSVIEWRMPDQIPIAGAHMLAVAIAFAVAGSVAWQCAQRGLPLVGFDRVGLLPLVVVSICTAAGLYMYAVPEQPVRFRY
jgi:hypothetical protein